MHRSLSARQLRASSRVLAIALTALTTMLRGDGPLETPELGVVDPQPAAAGLRQIEGTWGGLELTPIVISPPLEYLPRELPPVRAPQWAFPEMDAAAVGRLLASVGLAPDAVAPLVTAARPLPGSMGLMLEPDAAFVRRLPADTRASLYHELDKIEGNPAQESAYRYFGTSVDEWLAGAPISPDTRALVEPLVYRQGPFLYFADLDLVRPQIADRNELQRLRKRLLRQVTYVARLQVSDSGDLDRVIEYWGRGGRRTDIRPLLESIAEGGGDAAIDITHLLPTLARQQLYRYPRMTGADLDKPILANCLWTALNFFNSEPDDRLLDMSVALATLKRDYYFVQDNFQLGDIVAFSDPAGNLFHAAVYIAGDLIFGKNGVSALAPWTLLPFDHFEGHYVDEYARGWRVSYLRRRDL